MSIDEEITKYYNEKYEKSKPAIIDVLCHLLGEEQRELVTKKVNSFEIVYTVTRKDLKRSLKNPNLDSNEKQLMEYFLDKMDKCKPFDFDKMNLKEIVAFLETNISFLPDSKKNIFEELKSILEFIESSGIDLKGIEEYLKEDLKEIGEFCKKHQATSPFYHLIGSYGEHYFCDFDGDVCTLHTYNNQEIGVITLPIYNYDFSPDNNYFWGILEYILGNNELGDSLTKGISVCMVDNEELGDLYTKMAYDKIQIYFGIMLAHELHQKGTFIFDNKYLTRNDKKYEKMKDNEVFKRIKKYFEPLFSEFLFNPNKVMDLVGKDNFKKFALWIDYLAPRLDDVEKLEEDFEDEMDEKEKERIPIPYEELDFDIMEVLDDMYVEYLKHQSVSLMTVDVKKINDAKNRLDTKKERERLEEEEDSKYYDITRIFKYLEQYGNCQIRFVSSNKTCDMADFRINQEGKLVVTKKILIYDRRSFDFDGNIDAQAKLKGIVDVVTYEEEDYDLVMSAILYYSLNGMTRISTNRDLKPVNKDAIGKLYGTLYPMYDLDLNDLIQWVKSSPNGQMNILARQNKKCMDNHDFQTVECKTRILNEKIKTVLGYWKRMSNARNKEEYQKAVVNWDNLKQGLLKL